MALLGQKTAACLVRSRKEVNMKATRKSTPFKLGITKDPATGALASKKQEFKLNVDLVVSEQKTNNVGA
jgi:hypothetical protein